jgi:hypothetical protein
MSNGFDEGRNNIYIIPGNYEDSGGVLGGAIKLRNAIEAIVIGYILFKVGSIVLSSLDVTIRIILFVALVLPVVLLCLIGIKGDSLTQYLTNVVMFRKRKRSLSYKLINTDDTYTIPPELQESKKKKKNILSKIIRKEV